MYAIAVGIKMVSTKLYLFFNFPAIICFWSSDQSKSNKFPALELFEIVRACLQAGGLP